MSNIFSSTFLSMVQFHSGLVSFLCYQAHSFLQITATFLALAVDIPHLSFNVQRNNYRCLYLVANCKAPEYCDMSFKVQLDKDV